ncbi:hypothetical protein RF11_05283 [Thelohanellus kitauei]|uniref:EGF-like domain-containing protein n=1 Tax=Thelohanellus kitauei TaxID=669202 RepID=A0A0C2JI90_THEKT|nr:hypothetical protein RF11_05283 [Thelohanellus kitauei]
MKQKFEETKSDIPEYIHPSKILTTFARFKKLQAKNIISPEEIIKNDLLGHLETQSELVSGHRHTRQNDTALKKVKHKKCGKYGQLRVQNNIETCNCSKGYFGKYCSFNCSLDGSVLRCVNVEQTKGNIPEQRPELRRYRTNHLVFFYIFLFTGFFLRRHIVNYIRIIYRKSYQLAYILQWKLQTEFDTP